MKKEEGVQDVQEVENGRALGKRVHGPALATFFNKSS